MELKMKENDDRLLSRREAAKFLGVTKGTLEVWACTKRYPLPVSSKFWDAKGYGLLVAPILIIIIFYGYTAILGRNILALDIATFMIAIVIGQLVTAKLLTGNLMPVLVRRIGVCLLLSQIVAYGTFTFYPPPFPLFIDSRNGTSGIPVRPDQTLKRSILLRILSLDTRKAQVRK